MQAHLTTYIQRRNLIAKCFGKKQYSPGNLTATDRAELLRELEGELSPENLCCDGELSGHALRTKEAWLNGAKEELEKLEAGCTYKSSTQIRRELGK